MRSQPVLDLLCDGLPEWSARAVSPMTMATATTRPRPILMKAFMGAPPGLAMADRSGRPLSASLATRAIAEPGPVPGINLPLASGRRLPAGWRRWRHVAGSRCAERLAAWPWLDRWLAASLWCRRALCPGWLCPHSCRPGRGLAWRSRQSRPGRRRALWLNRLPVAPGQPGPEAALAAVCPRRVEHRVDQLVLGSPDGMPHGVGSPGDLLHRARGHRVPDGPRRVHRLADWSRRGTPYRLAYDPAGEPHGDPCSAGAVMQKDAQLADEDDLVGCSRA